MTVAAQRRGFLARLFGWEGDRVDAVIEHAREAVEIEDEHQPEPEPEPEPAAEEDNTVELLEHVLDSLGQAHHRPFSRA